MKLSDALEVFLDAKLADGVADTTVRWYRKRLKRLVAYLEDADLGEVGTMDLRQFVVSLRQQGTLWAKHPYREAVEGELSPATRQGYVRALKTFFHWLMVEGCVSENPADGIKLPPVPKGLPRGVEPEDVQALLEATAGEDPAAKRDRALLLFLADTGCRVGGAVGVKVRDVDLEERVAQVIEKGSKPRLLIFTPTTAQAIREWLDACPMTTGWLFPNLKNGEQLMTSGINQILQRLRERAGVEGICNPHSFRHAFARQYLLNGGDLATLSDLLGHADVGVTKRFYSIFYVEELRQQHDRFSPVAHMDLGETRGSRGVGGS